MGQQCQLDWFSVGKCGVRLVKYCEVICKNLISLLVIACFMCSLILVGTSAKVSASVGNSSMVGGKCMISFPQVYLNTNQKNAEDKINDDIYSYVMIFKNGIQNGGFDSGQLAYSVEYEDGNYISILFKEKTYSHSAKQPELDAIGFNYNKWTGERMHLSKFVELKSDDIGIIMNQPLYSIENGTFISKSDSFIDFYLQRDNARVSYNYFITKNGAIGLLYRPHELAASDYGCTYIELNSRIIKYFNERK